MRPRVLLLVVLMTGCASTPPARVPPPEPPLIGRVWDVRQQRWSDLATVEAAVRAARFVMLGETHDNPEHHALQARLIRAVASGDRRPPLAFEMLETTQQVAVDGALAAAPQDPEALAAAVDWRKSGWPAFALYRPVFAAGLELGLPIVAASLPKAEVKALVRGGELNPEIRARLDLEGPLPEAAVAQLREEMAASHCGMLPEKMMDPMILGQRARDVQLAMRVEAADAGQGAVLIAGSGHVRNDFGVAALLSRWRPERTILSVAALEVRDGLKTPVDYGPLPYDFVVFTVAAPREDPCAAFKGR